MEFGNRMSAERRPECSAGSPDLRLMRQDRLAEIGLVYTGSIRMKRNTVATHDSPGSALRRFECSARRRVMVVFH